METKAKLSSLQSLIMARNRIIFNTTKDSTEAFDNFPNPSGVSFDRQCAKCEYKNICALTLRYSSYSFPGSLAYICLIFLNFKMECEAIYLLIYL